jgi:predicted RNase H-like HicB family nuclease
LDKHAQRRQVIKMRIILTARLPIKITEKPKWFVASCPALDVVSQGETAEQAKTNIAEALTLFLRSCVERGTLDAVLKRCGFTSVVEPKGEFEPIGQVGEEEYVDIPLYLLSKFEENRQCHTA